MLFREIVSGCLIGGSLSGGALLFDTQSEEAHLRYMSGCVPLVAQFTAHERGYRKIVPSYRKQDEAAARTICDRRWAERRKRRSGAVPHQVTVRLPRTP